MLAILIVKLAKSEKCHNKARNEWITDCEMQQRAESFNDSLNYSYAVDADERRFVLSTPSAKSKQGKQNEKSTNLPSIWICNECTAKMMSWLWQDCEYVRRGCECKGFNGGDEIRSWVTFYPLAQIEGSHDLIAYPAAIEHGIWCMVYGLWCMVYGIWQAAGLLSDVLIWNAFEHVATLMGPQSAILA